MKILSMMSLVLSVAVLAGIAFLVLEITELNDRMDKLEANRAEEVRQLSNETSSAFARIGELDAELRSLTKRTDGMATTMLDASVEDVIEKKLAERETLKREKQAQQRRDWQERREKRELNRLLETLQLDDEIKGKVKTIIVQSREDRQEFFLRLRGEGNADQNKIREGMQKINNGTDEAIKKILSEDQFEKYADTQARNRKQWELILQGMGGHQRR